MSTLATSPPSPDLPPVELLERLVGQAAFFNLFAVPDRTEEVTCPRNGKVGFESIVALHRFRIGPLQTRGNQVAASNVVGERLGTARLRWLTIPWAHRAVPGAQHAVEAVDPLMSQRVVLDEMTFSFGDGTGGFRSFGTGRTFPTSVPGSIETVVAGVGALAEGYGEFEGAEANLTVCGSLCPTRGFQGHIELRVIDRERRLTTSRPLPPIKRTADPDPDHTWIMWVGEKGEGPDYENSFSFDQHGTPRGLNIPTELRRCEVDCAALDGGLRTSELTRHGVVGREIGYGRGSDPEDPPVGTLLRAVTFEGVARYTIHDERRNELGSVTTNVLEGRRLDTRFPEVPHLPGLRFGFFGPIVFGTGCFSGVTGFFYGVSGSVLVPPPGVHVVTHLYVARLYDPDGRFRMRATDI